MANSKILNVCESFVKSQGFLMTKEQKITFYHWPEAETLTFSFIF